MGNEGEVRAVYVWPLSARQVAKLKVGEGLSGACDVIVAFDRICAGGKHNTRRVRYDGRFYIEYHRARGGRVYLGGWVAARVAELATEFYGRVQDSV